MVHFVLVWIEDVAFNGPYALFRCQRLETEFYVTVPLVFDQERMDEFYVAFGLDKEEVRKWLDEHNMVLDMKRVKDVRRDGENKFVPTSETSTCDRCGAYITKVFSDGYRSFGLCCMK